MQQKQSEKIRKKKKRILLLIFHKGTLRCRYILLFLQNPYLGLQWSRIYLLAKEQEMLSYVFSQHENCDPEIVSLSGEHML